MAEHYRDEDPNAPQNPPTSVVNPRVRRAALWTYVGPLVAFFVAVGVALGYFATRPPDRQTTDDDRQALEEREPNAIGTTGDPRPGGHSPDPVPATPREEIEERGVVRDLSAPPGPNLRPENTLTDLGDVLEARRQDDMGRHVDVKGVRVVEVTSPTSFWVEDGAKKVAVVAPKDSAAVRNGQRVDVVGMVESDGTGGVRIRASRVDVRH
jgi:hypothetical protein